jgi:preprotein translocase subunit YajC
MNILPLLGIANAYADTAAAGAGSSTGGLMSVLPMFIILGLFMYLMIIRPQSKRAKEHKNFVINLKKGDEVITSGGIMGKIDSISDDFVSLNIADNVNINIQKNAIVSCIPKGTMNNAPSKQD